MAFCRREAASDRRFTLDCATSQLVALYAIVANELSTTAAFNVEVWEHLASLVARYSGVALPAPCDEGHCSDCAEWGVRFELGPSLVCVRCYTRRKSSTYGRI